MTYLIRLSGLILLVLPFLPLSGLWPDRAAAAGLLPPGIWLLGCFIVAAAAFVFCTVFPSAASLCRRCFLGTSADSRHRTAVLLAVLLLFVELLIISRFAFAGRYHLIDSAAQLFQAKIFASGRISGALAPPASFFIIQNMVLEPGRWYSQYPPLHSLLLVPGVLSGMPWLAPILLTLVTALILIAACRRIFGSACAEVLALLLVLAPFFLFMGASLMNHVTAAFLMAALLYSFKRWEAAPYSLWPAGAGAAVGGLLLTRPLSGAAAALVFAAAAMLAFERRVLAWSLAAALPPLLAAFVLLGCYNAATTGDPWTPGYVRLWGEAHGLGFHRTPWGGQHTPAAGLLNEAADLSRLNEYLFEWPAPALLPFALYCLFAAKFSRWDKRLWAAFIAVPAAYLFYWHRDSFLGPRFLYCSIMFLLPLTARAMNSGIERLSATTFSLPGVRRAIPAADYAAAFLLICLAYTLFVGLPQRFLLYRSSMPTMKEDIRKQAEEAGLANAVIFIPVSWGNRLIAELREQRVSAALVETAYRRVDHCELWLIAETARQHGKPVQWTETRINELLERGEPVAKINAAGDPSLRLRPNVKLDTGCGEELHYDRAGFRDYTAHLLENDADLSGDIVIARDMRKRNPELLRYFSGKAGYLYRGGKFTRIEDAANAAIP